MGLWSGGCDEEEKEFYYQKIKSETNYHKNEHETSFTNESLQVGNIAFEKIELEKENAELKAQIEKMKKDFSNALDSAYSNQSLYELWKRWECK